MNAIVAGRGSIFSVVSAPIVKMESKYRHMEMEMRRKIIIAAVATGAVVAGTLTAAFATGGDAAIDPTLTEDEAKAIALLSTPGDVVEVELDTDEGPLAYEVEVDEGGGSIVEVVVNANTGEVILVETDDDDGPEDD